MERPQLAAKVRTPSGSRSVERMRKGGQIPGVVYGKAVKPTPVVVDQREFTKFMRQRAGEHGLVTLKIEENGKTSDRPVLIKSLDHEPVYGAIRHIDFHAIVLTEHVRVKVPVVLKGDAVGVKQDGGVLEHFLREIEVDCLPTEIPKQIEHDISAMKIGDTLHVKDVAAPSGARIVTDPEAGLASVLARQEEKLEEPTEAVAEPEVLREKKPDEEGAAEGKGEGKGKAEAKAEPKAEKKEDKK